MMFVTISRLPMASTCIGEINQFFFRIGTNSPPSTTAQNLAKYVIIKTDPTKLKLVLKGVLVNNWKAAFKDHLKQFISVIRFKDNPLKALVLRKDVDVVKFLVSQKFFSLEGVSLTF